MAYNLRYQSSFVNDRGQEVKVYFYSDGYDGEARDLKVVDLNISFSKRGDSINAPIKGYSCDLTVLTKNEEFEFLIDSQIDEHIVQVYLDGVNEFTGYYNYEGFFQQENNNTYEYNLFFVDGITYGKQVFYTAADVEGNIFINDIIKEYFIEVDPNYKLNSTLYIYILSEFNNLLVRQGYINGKSYYEIFESISTALIACAFLKNNIFVFKRNTYFPQLLGNTDEFILFDYIANVDKDVDQTFKVLTLDGSSLFELPDKTLTYRELYKSDQLEGGTIEQLERVNEVNFVQEYVADNILYDDDFDFDNVIINPDGLDPLDFLDIWDVTYDGTTTVGHSVYQQNSGFFQNRFFIPVVRNNWTADDRRYLLQDEANNFNSNYATQGFFYFSVSQLFQDDGADGFINFHYDINLKYQLRNDTNGDNNYEVVVGCIPKISSTNFTYYLRRVSGAASWETTYTGTPFLGQILNTYQKDDEVTFGELIYDFSGVPGESEGDVSEDFTLPDFPSDIQADGDITVELIFGFARQLKTDGTTNDKDVDLYINEIRLKDNLIPDQDEYNVVFPTVQGNAVDFDYGGLAIGANTENSYYDISNTLYKSVAGEILPYYEFGDSSQVFYASFFRWCTGLKKNFFTTRSGIGPELLYLKDSRKWFVSHYNLNCITGLTDVELYQIR